MEATTCIKPKTLAELVPELSSILSKQSIQILTARQQPQVSGTAEKCKPLTAVEMRAALLTLRTKTPKTVVQEETGTKRKNWNSSIKVDKTLSRTSNGQLQRNPVKKALDFHSRPKPIKNSRGTIASESTKFLKPDMAKKKLFPQVRTNIRISGISDLSETPVLNKPIGKQMTVANKENILKRFTETPVLNKPIGKQMTVANKENIPKHSKIKAAPPSTAYPKSYLTAIPDTPLSNESWKSSCDASFLQKEREINDVEEKAEVLAEERTLEKIANIPPPVSTPFREYRNVEQFFDDSHDVDNSTVYRDNTIMNFDNPSDSLNNKREESVIVALCELLDKAKVENTTKDTELEDLLQFEKRTENMIAALNKVLDLHLASLESVRKLIQAKQATKMCANKTLTPQTQEGKMKKNENGTLSHQVATQSSSEISVIQLVNKSPSYKIPKKNLCLRKKVFYKSTPSISNQEITPLKTEMGSQASNIYMKMKERMNFLSTPKGKQPLDVSSTPALTSHNLQKQLSKLYSEN